VSILDDVHRTRLALEAIATELQAANVIGQAVVAELKESNAAAKSLALDVQRAVDASLGPADSRVVGVKIQPGKPTEHESTSPAFHERMCLMTPTIKLVKRGQVAQKLTAGVPPPPG